MERSEAAKVITYANSLDRRQQPAPQDLEMQATAWAQLLARVDVRDAIAAVSEFYSREGAKWITPGDIVQRAGRHAAQRAKDQRLADRLGLSLAEFEAQRAAAHEVMRAEGAPLLEVES